MGKESELIKAAKTGDIRTLERHFSHLGKRSSMIGSIKKHLHPNIQDEVGYTLLHHATLNGQRETVAFLLRSGASTTIPDSSGSYPLHLASWKGDIEIVKLLVTQGPSRANVDQQSNTEDTAIHLASQYGYCGVVEFLLERHANPMVKNIRGETPLDLAAQFGHVDTVHVLISHHPEILRLSRPEICPLHLAARNGHSVVVLSLINAGIPINSVCKSGSALHEAALCGKEETVKLLLDKGIDVNLKDSENRTVLSLLADFNAEKYSKIKSMIQSVANKGDAIKGRYIKPRKHRLLAIPRKDSKPLQQYEPSGNYIPLQYKEGDTIVVQRRQSTKRYIGVHMTTKEEGYFQCKDVRFYQDIDGKLHRVDHKDIFESPDDGSLHILQQSSVLSQNLDAALPLERKSMLVPRTDRSNSEAHNHQRSLSTSSSDNQSKEKKKPRLSEKEKRFILSKDKGDYSQLAPVTAPASRDAEIKEVTLSNEAAPNKGEYIGNYYLLEVGNFDTPPPVEGRVSEVSRDRVEATVRHSAPQYENVKLKRPPPPGVIEKPRSVSHGALQNNLVTDPEPIRQRPLSFRTQPYENVDLNSTGGIPQVPPLSSIDSRAPMPLPPPSSEKRKGLTRNEYSEVGGGASGEFQINDDREDVMVSCFNPNYSQVAFRRRYEVGGGGASDDSSNKETGAKEDTTRQAEVSQTLKTSPEGGGGGSPEAGGGVLIIPQDSHPFAGLVQSSSVVSGLSDIGGMEDLPSPRQRLKSVWDDRRVSKEWNEINNYLKDVTSSISQYESTLSPTPPLLETTPDSNEEHPVEEEEEEKGSVSIWLSGMGLRGYTSTFESNGFDDVRFMGGGLLDIEDLKEIGIYDNDQGTIMIKTALLPPPPRLRGITNVEEWLSGLHLSHLSGHFEGFTLEKISSLWELQLSTVLGIDYLGYRKRLLYGISELKKDRKSGSNVKLPANDDLSIGVSPVVDVDFTKDYSQISSTKIYDSPLPINEVDTLVDSSAVWNESKIHTKATPTTTSSNDTSLRSDKKDHTPGHASPVRGSEYATIPSNQELIYRNEGEKKNNPPPPGNAKNYLTWYLGSALVKGTTGRYSAEEACLKLRNQTDGIAKMPQIILSISWKGVKFVDADSKMVVSTHLIRDISHCCPDIEDPRVFAYLTKEKETNRNYCHVFMVENKEIADEIILTVGQAFEVAYQAVVRARSNYKSPNESPKRTSQPSIFKRKPKKKLSSESITENGIR